MALVASSSLGSSTVLQPGTAQADFANPPSSRSLQPSAGLSRGHVTSVSTGGQRAALANGQDTGSYRYGMADQSKPALYGVSSDLVGLARAQTEEQPLAQRSRPQVSRSRTDSDIERQAPNVQPAAVEEAGELRHGWEDQYNSSEFLGLLSSVRVPASLNYWLFLLLTETS